MEMVVVAVVALMLFNPRELPKMLRSLAKFWGQLRATADEFKDTIMTADGVDEIQELVKGTKGQIRQVETDARRELMKARAEMRKAQQKLLKANQAKLEKQTRERALEKAESGEGSTADDSDGSHGHTDDGHDDAPVAARAPHDREPGHDHGEHGEAPEPEERDDAPVPATAPHDRKPSSTPKSAARTPAVGAPPAVGRPPAPKADAPSPTDATAAPSATGGADDDAHNQGAA